MRAAPYSVFPTKTLRRTLTTMPAQVSCSSLNPSSRWGCGQSMIQGEFCLTSVFRPQAYCTSEKYCTLHSPHNGQMFGRLHLCCKYQRHTHLRCRRAIAETTCKLLTRGICQPTEELSLHCRKHFTERTLQYSTVGLSLRREVCRSLPTKTQGLRFQFSLDCFADIGLTVDPKDTLPPPAAWVKQKVPALITRLKTYQEAIN